VTAKIAGFVTRDQAGLRAPKSISRNVSAESGGVALHYGGPAANLEGHLDCVAQWRGWQRFHMDSRGWADIAYTMGVCDHGYVFAGRGAGVRTAAQGTNDGNQRYYAVCWLGGAGEVPTQEALDAFEWAVLNLRKTGAGKSVRPHKSFHSTSCPGPELAALAGCLDGKDISVPAAGDRVLGLTDPPMHGQDVLNVQNFLNSLGNMLKLDGSYGPATAKVVQKFKDNRGITERGWGPLCWARARKEIRERT
jgi:hypothetical protein